MRGFISAVMPPSLFRGVHEGVWTKDPPPPGIVGRCGRGHQTHDKDNESFEKIVLSRVNLSPCMIPALYQPSMRSRKLASPFLVFVWALSGPALAHHSDFVWTISRHYVDFFRPCLNPLGTCVGPPRPFDGSLRLCVRPLECLLLSPCMDPLRPCMGPLRPCINIFMPCVEPFRPLDAPRLCLCPH